MRHRVFDPGDDRVVGAGPRAVEGAHRQDRRARRHACDAHGVVSGLCDRAGDVGPVAVGIGRVRVVADEVVAGQHVQQLRVRRDTRVDHGDGDAGTRDARAPDRRPVSRAGDAPIPEVPLDGEVGIARDGGDVGDAVRRGPRHARPAAEAGRGGGLVARGGLDDDEVGPAGHDTRCASGGARRQRSGIYAGTCRDQDAPGRDRRFVSGCRRRVGRPRERRCEGEDGDGRRRRDRRPACAHAESRSPPTARRDLRFARLRAL